MCDEQNPIIKYLTCLKMEGTLFTEMYYVINRLTSNDNYMYRLLYRCM
jgi:hypothetical protein